MITDILNHEIHSETGIFKNILFANTLLPVKSKPTRYRKQSAKLIDNVITNIYDEKIYLVLFWIFQIICTFSSLLVKLVLINL